MNKYNNDYKNKYPYGRPVYLITYDLASDNTKIKWYEILLYFVLGVCLMVTGFYLYELVLYFI